MDHRDRLQPHIPAPVEKVETHRAVADRQRHADGPGIAHGLQIAAGEHRPITKLAGPIRGVVKKADHVQGVSGLGVFPHRDRATAGAVDGNGSAALASLEALGYRRPLIACPALKPVVGRPHISFADHAAVAGGNNVIDVDTKRLCQPFRLAGRPQALRPRRCDGVASQALRRPGRLQGRPVIADPTQRRTNRDLVARLREQDDGTGSVGLHLDGRFGGLQFADQRPNAHRRAVGDQPADECRLRIIDPQLRHRDGVDAVGRGGFGPGSHTRDRWQRPGLGFGAHSIAHQSSGVPRFRSCRARRPSTASRCLGLRPRPGRMERTSSPVRGCPRETSRTT